MTGATRNISMTAVSRRPLAKPSHIPSRKPEHTARTSLNPVSRFFVKLTAGVALALPLGGCAAKPELHPEDYFIAPIQYPLEEFFGGFADGVSEGGGVHDWPVIGIFTRLGAGIGKAGEGACKAVWWTFCEYATVGAFQTPKELEAIAKKKAKKAREKAEQGGQGVETPPAASYSETTPTPRRAAQPPPAAKPKAKTKPKPVDPNDAWGRPDGSKK